MVDEVLPNRAEDGSNRRIECISVLVTIDGCMVVVRGNVNAVVVVARTNQQYVQLIIGEGM